MMKKWRMVIVASVFLAWPVYVIAQQATTPSTPPHEHPAGPETKLDASEKHPDRQAKHEKMIAERKAMDARLDEKLAVMNAAKGDQKLEAMAAVINELVSQRKEMRPNPGPRHKEMKCPRMGQQAAMPPDCPMMKQPSGAQADTPKKEGTP
jgi:hypothetical protein